MEKPDPKKTLSIRAKIIFVLLIIAAIVVFAVLNMVSRAKPPFIEPHRVDVVDLLSASARTWPKREIAGVSIELPGIPQLQSSSVPSGDQRVLTSQEIHTLQSQGVMFSVGHYKFINIANLDGAVSGVVESLRKKAGVSNFSSKVSNRPFEEMKARSIVSSFTFEGKNASFLALTFSRGHDLWHISVTGPPEKASEFAEHAFGSVRSLH